MTGDNADELHERKFWKALGSNPPLYGADTPQSLFDEKVEFGWNLRKLGCLLHKYGVQDIPGVTTPMTYFGMWRVSLRSILCCHSLSALPVRSGVCFCRHHEWTVWHQRTTEEPFDKKLELVTFECCVVFGALVKLPMATQAGVTASTGRSGVAYPSHSGADVHMYNVFLLACVYDLQGIYNLLKGVCKTSP